MGFQKGKLLHYFVSRFHYELAKNFFKHYYRVFRSKNRQIRIHTHYTYFQILSDFISDRTTPFQCLILQIFVTKH